MLTYFLKKVSDDTAFVPDIQETDQRPIMAQVHRRGPR